MELRQLVYAEAVARHRHFTRAAEELHVAQSALSHQIRRLEAELGTELFERTSRRVVPTEAGEAVAARARRVLAEVDGVRGELDELRGLVRGRISIGALLPAGGIEVTTLLARFSQAFPGIEVGLREGTAADMLELIDADELDVAFSLSPASRPGGHRGAAGERGGGGRGLSARDRARAVRVSGGRPRRRSRSPRRARARRSSRSPTRSSPRRRAVAASRSRAATPT